MTRFNTTFRQDNIAPQVTEVYKFHKTKVMLDKTDRDLRRLCDDVIGQESLSRLAVGEAAMASKELGIDTIRQDPALALEPEVVIAVELSEAPLPALDDLLAARELELGTTESLSGMDSVVGLAAHREKDLANGYTGADTLWLTESTPHSSLEPISPSTRKHLVDAQHMERVNPDPEVEGILSCMLGHVLVASNTGSLKSLAGDILLLP